jgi:hypothetical protein
MRLADVLLSGDLDTVKLMHSLQYKESRTVLSVALDGIRREEVPVSTPAKVADLQIQGRRSPGDCAKWPKESTGWDKPSLDASGTLNH